MPYKNPRDLLIAAANFPATVEAALPAGAPRISTMLADVAGQFPALPDLPIEIPDLPAPPALPAVPEMPGLGPQTGAAGLRRYITGAAVGPAAPAMAPAPPSPPPARTAPTREIIPLVYE